MVQLHSHPPITEGVTGRSPVSASKTGDVRKGMCFDYTAFRHFLLESKPVRALGLVGNLFVSVMASASGAVLSANSGEVLGTQ